MNPQLGLTTEDMIDAATVFQEAYDHVMANLAGSEIGQKALQFAGHVVLSEKPYMLVTEEGVVHATSLVFADEAIRDFIFTLHFTFFSRWGRSKERYQGLVANLTQGLMFAGPGDLMAIPDQIATRLTSEDDVRELLVANPWLTVLLMMQLFLVIQAQPLKQQ